MEKWKEGRKNNSTWAGLLLLGVGLVFLLGNLGFHLPYWVLSWHTLLIIIGLLIGYKRNFQGPGWLILILVGSYYTLSDMVDADLSKYFFAASFIIIGLFLILRPKSNCVNPSKWKKKQANFTAGAFAEAEGATTDAAEPKTKGWVNENDVIDAVSVFGGTDQQVYSKHFKGGDLIAIFGGCSVNLTQADFEGAIVLEVVAVFGGVKIIIPSSWIVKSEVTAIFGGIEDKRGPVILSDGGAKIIKITGLALFGGVEIRNF